MDASKRASAALGEFFPPSLKNPPGPPSAPFAGQEETIFPACSRPAGPKRIEAAKASCDPVSPSRTRRQWLHAGIAPTPHASALGVGKSPLVQNLPTAGFYELGNPVDGPKNEFFGFFKKNPAQRRASILMRAAHGGFRIGPGIVLDRGMGVGRGRPGISPTATNAWQGSDHREATIGPRSSTAHCACKASPGRYGAAFRVADQMGGQSPGGSTCHKLGGLKHAVELCSRARIPITRRARNPTGAT